VVAWPAASTEALGEDAAQLANTYVLAHSVGCQALLRCLASLPDGVKLGGALCVAGWWQIDQPWDSIRPWLGPLPQLARVRAAMSRLMVLLSDNDPFTADHAANGQRAIFFNMRTELPRRGLLGGLALIGAGVFLGTQRTAALPPDRRTKMNTRKIPKTGEELPVIGLGTWQTFDVGPSPAERASLLEVLRLFFAQGGRLIDSSPMYGRAEAVVGELLAELRPTPAPFLATKVWTSGRLKGEEQMRRSVERMDRLGRGQVDLMQVHNLLDLRTHLPVLREWKAAGKIRYLGITHYSLQQLDELERLVRSEQLDFVQLPYSLAVRDAEKRLLPAAHATGTAVLVMRPFEECALFRRVRGLTLPSWASDFDCTSWAQFFLKFILSHPAVTCPIPATASPAHMVDNLQAVLGRLPDEKIRQRMIQLLQ